MDGSHYSFSLLLSLTHSDHQLLSRCCKGTLQFFSCSVFLKKKVSGFRRNIRDGLAQQSSQVMGMPSTPSWLVSVRTLAGEGSTRFHLRQTLLFVNNQQAASFSSNCTETFSFAYYRPQLYPIQSMSTCSVTTPTPAPKGRKGTILMSPQSSLM